MDIGSSLMAQVDYFIPYLSLLSTIENAVKVSIDSKKSLDIILRFSYRLFQFLNWSHSTCFDVFVSYEDVKSIFFAKIIDGVKSIPVTELPNESLKEYREFKTNFDFKFAIYIFNQGELYV